MPVLAQAVTELLKLAPATAVLLTLDADGRPLAEQEVPAALVQRGDHLRVRPARQPLRSSAPVPRPPRTERPTRGAPRLQPAPLRTSGRRGT
jgi:hypothetical protein